MEEESAPTVAFVTIILTKNPVPFTVFTSKIPELIIYEKIRNFYIDYSGFSQHFLWSAKQNQASAEATVRKQR